MRKLYLPLLAVLCLTNISCSTKFAYNFLDWAIEWKIKSFVSLHGEQKDFMKGAVDRFHLWHRTTQLPLYADYLTDVANRLEQKPFNAKQIHEETDKVQVFMDQSLEQAIPDLAKLMAQLNDKQAKELMENVAEERDEYVEKYVDVTHKEQVKLRYEDFMDYFKPHVGSVSKAQKKIIKAWAGSMKPYEALNVQQQLRWEGDLKHTLENRDKPDVLDKGLRKLMFYRTDDWIPELEANLDYNQTLTYQMIEQLLLGLSEKQKKHLLEELRDYAETCRELSKKT